MPAPQPEQFHLSIAGLGGQLTFHPAGFTLTATKGTLRLPPAFGAVPGGAGLPAISLEDGQPLQLEVSPDALQFSGALQFKDFSFHAGPADSGLLFSVQEATLTLPTIHFPVPAEGFSLPQLSGVKGKIHLPLPGIGQDAGTGTDQEAGTARIGFEEMTFDLNGLPIGTIYLAEDLPPIELGGGFTFTLLGGKTNEGPVTGLSVSRPDQVTIFQLNGQARLAIPVDILSNMAEGPVVLEAAAGLIFRTDKALPQLVNFDARAGGDFCLGGRGPQGLVVAGADLWFEDIHNLPVLTPETPVKIRLSGEITVPNGPKGGIEDACFIFEGKGLPRFTIKGISGGTGTLDLAGTYLPLKVNSLRLNFDTSLPLPDILYPRNIKAVIGGEVDLQHILRGGVNDLSIWFNENGVPQLMVDTIKLEVTGLELAEGFKLGGGLGIGGLTQIPEGLVLAGKLSGELSGAGVEALVAFGVVGGFIQPLGVSLEASLGTAGIPVAQTGFLIIGASGGISFTGDNADPDDLRAYIEIDKGQITKDDSKRPPQEAPDARQQESIAPAVSPTGALLKFQCPEEECPPRTVGILYQPHPDSALYPHRVIFKFSALDNTTVDRILEAAQIPKESLQEMTAEAAGMKVKAIAAQVSQAILQAIGSALPASPEYLGKLRDPLNKMLEEGLHLAKGSVYDALVKVAYKGVRAPNETIKLTGTLSYAGISAFLSVTGGFVISPTVQSAGIVGSLNLVGIPIGTLRGFLTATNSAGNPDPALCGSLIVALGPLELGKLRMSYRPGLDITLLIVQITELLLAQLQSSRNRVAIEKLVTRALQALDSQLLEGHGNDVAAAIAALKPEELLAITGLLLQQPLEQDPEVKKLLQDFFLALYDRLWGNFNPQMLLCGSVHPKLFGMPLGGELVGVSANGTKTDFAASFRFSPAVLFGKVFGGVTAPIDVMTLSFGLSLPSPRPFIEAGISGDFGNAEKMKQVAEEGFRYAMNNAVATIEYEIAPMGFRLAKAEARLIMPDLLHHPAHPDSQWVRPEKRKDGLPSRLAVLEAAIAANKLGNIFWKGTSDDLKALLKLPDTEAITNLSLQECFFPHGGILGAGYLALPKLFTKAPPVDKILQLIDAKGGQPEKLKAALEIAQDILAGLTQEDELGQMGFYIPAPNPPLVAFKGAKTPMELAAYMQGQPFDLDNIQTGTQYSLEESFFSGYLGTKDRPVTLLGIPIGSAQLQVEPPKDGAEGYLVATATVPEDSWLKDLVGLISLKFIIRQAPAKPVTTYFSEKYFPKKLRKRPIKGSMDVLEPIEISVPSGFTKSPVITFPSEATDQVKLINQLIDDLKTQLPKMELVAEVENLHLPPVPPELQQLLQLNLDASAMLYAYSPLYAYGQDLPEDGPLAKVQREGGVALRAQGNITFKIGTFQGSVNKEVFFVLTPGPARLPAFTADIALGKITSPVLDLESARLFVSTEPAAVRLRGEINLINLGLFQIRPLAGKGPLRISVDSSGLLIDPAQLIVPALGPGCLVRIHGQPPDAPFALKLDGDWAASLSISNLAVKNPFNPSTDLFAWPDPVQLPFKGAGLNKGEFTWTFSGGPEVLLQTNLPLRFKSGGFLTIRSDGSLDYEAGHVLSFPPHLEASGRLKIHYQSPTDFGIELQNAQVQLNKLPAFTADIGITRTEWRATGRFGNARIGISNLCEASAGQWNFVFNAENKSVTLSGQDALTIWILGKQAVQINSLSISADVINGKVELVAKTNGEWLILLPNLLEVQPQSIKIDLNSSNPGLSLENTKVRVLRHHDNNWIKEEAINFPLLTKGQPEIQMIKIGLPDMNHWQSVPGAEFRMSGLHLGFWLKGETVTAKLDYEVAIRTAAKKPNGEPWAQVSNRFSGELNGNGEINLQFPSWPSYDSIKAPVISARGLCEEAKKWDIKLPAFPEEPKPPQEPNFQRPKWPAHPIWVAYDEAIKFYQKALGPYRDAKQKYDEAVKKLNDALAECSRDFPYPPEELRNLKVPSVTFKLADLLR